MATVNPSGSKTPAKLDYSKPYAEVHGLPGVTYEQNGQYYNIKGAPAVPIIEIEEPPPIDDNSQLPYIFCIEHQSPPRDAPAEENKTLEEMHWKHLKSLVESYGGTYINKEQSIEFLKRKK